MAIKIADAFISATLDTSQIDAALAQIEARIAGIQASANSALSTANAASSAASSALSNASAAAANAASIGGGGAASAASSGASVESSGGTFSLLDMLTPNETPKSIFTHGPIEALKSAGRNITGVFEKASTNISEALKMSAEGVDPKELGIDVLTGAASGVSENKDILASAMRDAVDGAIRAGKDEAEVSSPSRRSSREIGGPIIQGVELEIARGGPAIASAFTNTLHFAFSKTMADMFGGTFISDNVTTVTNAPDGSGPVMTDGTGSTFGPNGIRDNLAQQTQLFAQAVDRSFAQGQPTDGLMASRVLASNLPDGVRSFGQELIEGALGTVLPSFLSGRAADLIGTSIGTKPILTAQQALGASQSADAGGLSDSPFTGGQFVFNNEFSGAGNFTDTERAVQRGIIQSMRRLGVSF